MRVEISAQRLETGVPNPLISTSNAPVSSIYGCFWAVEVASAAIC